MTVNPQENRKLQSKKLLVNALYQLMEKKPYQEITVTELCKKADVARRTFYRHFQTPNQILEYSVSETAQDFFARRDVLFLSNKNFQHLTILFFSFWKEHLDMLVLFRKKGLYYYLCDVFSKYLRETILHRLPQEFSEERKKAFLFISGGLWQLMDDWLEHGALKSPEEMGVYVDSIFRMITE